MAPLIQKPSSRRVAWLLSACLTLAAACTLGTVWLLSQSPGSAGGKQQAPAEANSTRGEQAPEAYTVKSTDIPHTILVTGELKAARTRDILVPNIRSGFGSSVTFLALEGSSVKQGERILEFDASTLLSQKAEAERVLDEAKLKIEKTKADLEVQRSDLLAALEDALGNLKVAELYGKIPKELQPANQYQKYQLDLEKATLARDKAKEKLANLEASVEAQMALVEVSKAQAEVDLKKIDGDIALQQIDAPQDGIIIYGDNWASNRKVQVGDSLFPGMPAMTIPDLASMQVVGFVYDTELRYLSSGMVCEMSLDAVPGKSWHGRIVSLTSVASRKGFASQHKVFRAVVQPETVEVNLWKPGMAVRLEVPVSLASNVPAIPREYLGIDRLGRYFVLKGGDPNTAAVQWVQIGAFSNSTVQITSGLSVGDKVFPIPAASEAKS
ncbi:MAG TPA: efflux RND transporter periplasmic adaptor subunit [Acidobacteriota bacterium]|nr:efflux RND transporter periplasmic adaptor subunit [Acidobacteriota bacterium]